MGSEASEKEEDNLVPFGISDVPDDEEITTEEKEDIKPDNTDGKKATDEGCPTSESDEEKEEEKVKTSKDEESDEGLGKSDDNASKVEEVEVEEEAPKEKQIKQKILSILQDAKAMDQKRNIRNYGRTFEFQGVKEQLRPVVPNDRRPQKAKRLDTLWSEVTAKKQGFSQPAVPTLEELKARKAGGGAQKTAVPTLEELKNKPKSSVPWTRKVNAQPVKKEVLAAQKEVEEFESCRKTLQENVKNEVVTTRKIQTVKKDEIVSICNTAIAEETKEKVIIESVKDAPKEVQGAKVDVEKPAANEVSSTMPIKKESVDMVSKNDTDNSFSITKTGSADAADVKAVESDSSRVKVSNHQEISKESLISNSEIAGTESFSESEKETSEEDKKGSAKEKKKTITITVKKEATPVKRDSTPVKRDSTPVKKESSPVTKESTPVNRDSTPIRKESTPVRKESTPAKKESTPVREESTPIRKESTPVRKESTPVRKE